MLGFLHCRNPRETDRPFPEPALFVVNPQVLFVRRYCCKTVFPFAHATCARMRRITSTQAETRLLVHAQGNLHIVDYSNSPFARPDIRILIEGDRLRCRRCVHCQCLCCTSELRHSPGRVGVCHRACDAAAGIRYIQENDYPVRGTYEWEGAMS